MIEKEKEKSKKEKIRRDIETIERHRVDQLKIKGWFRNFELTKCSNIFLRVGEQETNGNES